MSVEGAGLSEMGGGGGGGGYTLIAGFWDLDIDIVGVLF